jgi:hypothetical protein
VPGRRAPVRLPSRPAPGRADAGGARPAREMHLLTGAVAAVTPERGAFGAVLSYRHAKLPGSARRHPTSVRRLLRPGTRSGGPGPRTASRDPGTAPRDPGSRARGTRTPPPEREKREPRPRNVRTATPAQELTPRTRKTRGPPQVRTPRSVVAASPSGKRPTSVSCLRRRSHLHRPRRRTTRLRRTSCRRRRSFPRGGCRRRTNRSLPRPTSCRCCRCRDAFRWTPPPRGRPSAPDGVNRPCGRETPEPPRRGPRSPPG